MAAVRDFEKAAPPQAAPVCFHSVSKNLDLSADKRTATKQRGANGVVKDRSLPPFYRSAPFVCVFASEWYLKECEGMPLLCFIFIFYFLQGYTTNALATLPERQKGAGEVYRFAARVSSTSGSQTAMVGWAPQSLPLDPDDYQYNKMGYYSYANSGSNWDQIYQRQGSHLASQPSYGKLAQGGEIVTVYDRTAGTISFAWPGNDAEVVYSSVPKEPQLLPAFIFNNDGDSIQLVRAHSSILDPRSSRPWNSLEKL
jgi:hypothetical protein